MSESSKHTDTRVRFHVNDDMVRPNNTEQKRRIRALFNSVEGVGEFNVDKEESLTPARTFERII